MAALSGDGHRFDLFDLTCSNSGILSLDGVAENVHRWRFDPGTECRVRLPFLSRYVEAFHKFRNLSRLKALSKEIASAIDEGGYDLVFLHHCSMTQAPYVLRYLKTPSVFYSGDPPRGLYEAPISRSYERATRPLLLKLREMWYWPASVIEGRIYNRIVKRIYEKNMAFVDVLMANSYYSLETFRKLHGITSRVVYPGIDTNEFRTLGIEKRNIVLSVGGIEPIKGHDFVIESLACIDKEVRPELHIIGNRGYGVEKKYLEHLAAERGVAVRFEEHVSPERLVRLYNQAKVTCCGAVLEPFGLTPLESMACGTPVVAVKEGGFRESIRHGEGGYLCDRDAAKFGRCVEELLIDDDLHERLGCRARAYVEEHWNLDRVKRDLLDLFEYATGRTDG